LRRLGRSWWRRNWLRHFDTSQLASTLKLALPSCVVKPPFINVEEKIDKVVGRRTQTPEAFKSGMQLQALAVELHRSLKHRWAGKGVYRFNTHEEADEWMNRMLARSQGT
jgi:hypothetical protein